MKKISLIIIINLILAAGQLVLALGRSADGVSLSQLRQKQLELATLNQLLGEEVYTKSSLPYVASKSAALGLAGGTIRFVSGQVPIAVAAPQTP